MTYFADLHVHSRYSRATSKDLCLEDLAAWGARKGLTVIGTGDFTHPAWAKDLKDKLVPDAPGLFRLRDDLDREVQKRLPASCRSTVRFALQTEISTIYKKGEKTRKVHHVVLAPSFEAVDKMTAALARVGNLASDGRPILGLDSRHLLEIVLSSGEGSSLIPAHIWTPWFSALGSKSGFDSIAECYGDLSPHIFAVETGLSSDPAMNWRLSSLDAYRLVSNSDAHSAANLGREATAFEGAADYFSILRALKTGDGYGGTVEFFPEEGKYHLDGHRACDVRLTPEETEKLGGVCPVCGHPVTVGVLSRVCELADRREGYTPPHAGRVRHFLALPTLLSEILGAGSASKGVQEAYGRLLEKWGSEFHILDEADPQDLEKAGFSLLSEALRRMREGRVRCEGGYDGEYGVIRLFNEDELGTAGLWTVPDEVKRKDPSAPKRGPRKKERKAPAPTVEAPSSGLDKDQEQAVSLTEGPLLILAGPGTGKTRTLTHRLARLVETGRAAPEQCLAVTFTRRAAEEMRERLDKLLPGKGSAFPVMTFHALGHLILKEHAALLGFEKPIRVVTDEERVKLLVENGVPRPEALRAVEAPPREGQKQTRADEATVQKLREGMRERGWVSFDDLVALPVRLLTEHPEVRDAYRGRFPYISLDEFQDADADQYALTRLLAPSGGNVCAIGDPDQAIYGFRGGDAGCFEAFERDFAPCRKVSLRRNYRSAAPIVKAALQVIAPSTKVGGRVLKAVRGEGEKVTLHAAPDERAEAAYVVRTIEKLLGGSAFHSLDSGEVAPGEGAGYAFSDFAVLTRTGAQGEALAEVLHHSGLPFQRRGHESLGAHPFAKKVGDALWTAPVLGSFAEMFERCVGDLEADDEAKIILPALRRLAGECADAGEFKNRLSLGVDADLWDPRADRVTLLTLHASKGLEFPVVFVTGCEEGLLPFSFGDGGDGEVEEERRLMFVGMTRAKERLYLCRALRRSWRGSLQDRLPSPFLGEIDERWVKRTEEKRKEKKGQGQMKLF